MKKQDKYKQRADGRYYTCIPTGNYKDNGKPILKYIYAATSKELEKKINDSKYEISHGIYANDKGITVGEYAKKWLTVSKAAKSSRTKEMYQRIIDKHLDEIEHKKLGKLTRSDIQLQINSCIEYPRTCQQIKLTIKQILDCAVSDGLIVKNPCQNITLPRYVSKEKRPLTQIEKDSIKKADFTKREKALVYIAYSTGMRPSEIYALTKSDIDLKNYEITVNKSLSYIKTETFVSHPKTNSGIRVIQVPGATIEVIKDYMDEHDHLILFSNDNGEYMTKAAYANMFKQAIKKMEKAGGQKFYSDGSFNGLTPYYFRHNYCTELYYSGISLKEAQRLMGHSDYGMIMKVYSHLDEKKENTRKKIESLAL